MYVLIVLPDVPLLDKNAGVVDGLGQTSLENTGLQATVQELLYGETKHVIEFVLGLGEEAQAHQATQKGGTLEHALGVLLGEGEECTGDSAHLGEGVLCAPDLLLAAKSILAEEFHLAVDAFLLEGTARDARHFTVVMVVFTHVC
jgi:hypothetical protein